MSMPDDARGFTYSEQWRHECEVRYVMRLPTRERRAAYLEHVRKHRGSDAAARLMVDVQQAWRAARGDAAPSPQSDGNASSAAGGEPLTPVNGSFLASQNEGNSDPVGCVHSEDSGR